MGAQAGLVFDERSIWSSIYIEGPYEHDGLISIYLSSSNQGPVIVNFMKTYLLSHFPHKFQPVRLTGGLFEGEGIISCLYAGCQGVGEFGEIV